MENSKLRVKNNFLENFFSSKTSLVNNFISSKILKKNNSFFIPITIKNNRISAYLGVKKYNFNELTILAIAESLAKIFEKEKKNRIFIFTNGLKVSKKFFDFFVSKFLEKKLLIFCYKNQDHELNNTINSNYLLNEEIVDYSIFLNFKDQANLISNIEIYEKNFSFSLSDWESFFIDKFNWSVYKVKKIESKKIASNKITFLDEMNFSLETFFENLNKNKSNFFFTYTGLSNSLENIFKKVLKNTNLQGLKAKNFFNFSNQEYKTKNVKNAIMSNFFLKEKKLAVNFDSKLEKFEIFYKKNRIYKKISNEILLALFLEFKAKQNKENLIISVSEFNSDFIKNFIIKNGLNLKIFQQDEKILQTFKSSSNWISINSNGKVFLRNRKNIVNNLNFFLEILKIFVYFEEKNIDIFSKIENLQTENGYIIENFNSKTITESEFKYIVDSIREANKISFIETKKIKSFSDKNYFLKSKKIFLKNGSWIGVKFSYLTKKFNFFSSSNVKKNQIKKTATYQQEIANWFNYFLYSKRKTSISKKDFFKYSFFISLIAIILYFVFKTFFELDDKPAEIFKKFGKLILFNPRISFLSNLKIKIATFVLFFHFLISTFFYGLLLKKIVKFQGEKTKFFHFFVGSLIGIFFSNITPFTLGGDIITYWYLSKKGYKKSSIIAATSINLIINQVLLLILALVVFPFSFYFFPQIFQNPFTLIILVFSIFLNFLWFLILLVLSKFKKIQEFLIDKITLFLEWIPFLFFENINKLKSNLYVQIEEIRDGVNQVFKKPWFFLHCIFYKLMATYFPVNAILALFVVGQITEGNSFLSFNYFYFANVIQKMMSSISVTPGGVGINEYLVDAIFGKLFINKNSVKIFNFYLTLTQFLIPTIISFVIFLNYVLYFKLENRGSKFLEIFDFCSKVFWFIFFVVIFCLINFIF